MTCWSCAHYRPTRCALTPVAAIQSPRQGGDSQLGLQTSVRGSHGTTGAMRLYPNATPRTCQRFEYEPGADEAEREDRP